jgi:hypothetical protein
VNSEGREKGFRIFEKREVSERYIFFGLIRKYGRVFGE